MCCILYTYYVLFTRNNCGFGLFELIQASSVLSKCSVILKGTVSRDKWIPVTTT